MKKLKHQLRIYIPFMKAKIQTFLAYPISVYLFIFSSFLEVLANYYLWVAVYQNSNQQILGGFTIDEMITYIFMSYVTGSIVRVGIATDIGIDVVEGSIASNLIKPINYKVKLLFESLGGMFSQIVMPAGFVWLGLILVNWVGKGIMPPSLSTIIFYIVSGLMSFLILFFFEFCFGMIAFYTQYVWGMAMIKNALLLFLTGQIIPIVFFPEAVRYVFDYLPFTSMNYTPVMIYLGKLQGSSLYLAMGKQIAWVILLYILSCIVWHKATKRLTVLGG
ncbi:ABC-2 family transporter protein [Cellulosilyticum sp. ST5]|uniref:ABC transporter permease n=1 Tax=Cellulosilyticum sp. ST5 TaxID=3055805 RepID=UPI003977B9D4